MTTAIEKTDQQAPNLYRRIAEVAAAVDIVATGKTAQGTPTISIVDAENALRGLLSKHGLVTGYTFLTPPIVTSTRMSQAGNPLSEYQVHVQAWIVNADTPEERFEATLYDIGSSPSAAVSFCLKRWYRALFHLAEESDEGKPQGDGRTQPRTQARTQPRPAGRTASRSPQSLPEGPSGEAGGAGEAHNPTEQSPGGRAAASDGGEPAKASPPAPPAGFKQRLEARRKDLLIPLQVASALADKLKIQRDRPLTQAEYDLLDRALEVFSSGAKTIEEVVAFVQLEANAEHEERQEAEASSV